MKNLWNWVTLTWDRILLMTPMQQATLIGSIILPAGSLILIFSQFGQRIIRKLVKAKTLKTSGKIHITEEDIYNDLNWNGMRDFVKDKEQLK